MQFGDFDIRVISGGRMWFDGGTLFGVVPKVLWEKGCAANEQNRVELDTNCLIVRGPDGIGLVETGYGSKTSPRDRENFGLDEGNTLLANLARVGVEPDDVRWVALTHLHFDHAGGCTVRGDDGLRPTFSRARHFIQQDEWNDATSDLPELAGTYFRDDFEPLATAGLVGLVNGDAAPAPGITVRRTGGHSRGHQIVYLRSGSRTAVYLGDLCPTPAHLKTFWCTAYDQFPRTVRRIKCQILDEAVDKRWLVIFGHCVEIKAAYLARGEKGDVVVDESVCLS